MTTAASDDPREELMLLTRALGAYAELVICSGASGLEPASAELRAERSWQAVPQAPDAPEHGVASELSQPRTDEREGAAARPELGAPQPGVPHSGAHELERAPGGAAGREREIPPELLASLEGNQRAPGASEAPRESASSEPSPQQPAPAPRLAPEERTRRLEILREEVASCTACALHAGRTQTVFARGSTSTGICFVGEGPGFDEDRLGEPFVGKAGQLLDRMIQAMGLERDEVYVCNIVKCRPPENRKPLPEEIASCMPFLQRQLELVEPGVIVALGATAVEGLLGRGFGGIMRQRGKWKLYKGKVAVMPTFHPAYLLRTPKAKREVWQDLQAVLRHMGRPIPNPKK